MFKSRFGFKIRKHSRLFTLSLKNSPVFIKTGDILVVETNRGEELGVAIKMAKNCDRGGQHEEFSVHKIIRLATPEDIEILKNLPNDEHHYLTEINNYLQKENIELKIITCELIFNKKKLIVYYKQVEEKGESQKQHKKSNKPNFKNLGRELYNLFNIPVELRETGNRGEAKVLGGLGHCGQKLCCAGWLSKAKHVSIKMAKEQAIPINIPKITGLCEKLMCCLEYEHCQYHQGKLNDTVKTTPKDEDNLVEYAKMFKEEDKK
jgi:cell fate regulator YaaT (PSP1 superfamily)